MFDTEVSQPHLQTHILSATTHPPPTHVYENTVSRSSISTKTHTLFLLYPPLEDSCAFVFVMQRNRERRNIVKGILHDTNTLPESRLEEYSAERKCSSECAEADCKQNLHDAVLEPDTRKQRWRGKCRKSLSRC